MLDLRCLGAIPALPPPQARNKAGLTGMGTEVSTVLSLPMHALRGQEVQSKVSDLEGSKRSGYRFPYVLENAACVTPRLFRSTIILVYSGPVGSTAIPQVNTLSGHKCYDTRLHERTRERDMQALLRFKDP